MKLALSACQVTAECTELVPPGMLVCSDHANLLAYELLFVPLLGNALEDARVKATRFSTTGVGTSRPDESPVPFNPRAADEERQLLTDLTQAADYIAKADGWARPLNTFQALGPWLARMVPWIRSQWNGPDMVNRLLFVIGEASRVVDRPADRVYLGSCDARVMCGPAVVAACGAQLYALPAQRVVQCPACTSSYDVADRQTALLGRAYDRVFNATDTARVLVGFGMTVTPSLIRAWASRGDLAPVDGASDERGRPVYRVSDAIATLNEMARRRVERERARAVKGVSA